MNVNSKIKRIRLDDDVLFSSWTSIRSSSGKPFQYAFVNRGTHIDIGIRTPRSPRGSHEDSNFHLVHKLFLNKDEDTTKICFNPGKEPKTVEKAMGVLKEYIELYSVWLDTGKTIDEQIRERRN